ncbi:hypothetical protein RCG23_01490 [Neobacillus sp. PS3-34]|uniref:hypothetical protein n=1 Tax=Neobacillus sp. PS3-34 TaxID=3070678 RepID=UPI0027E01066|nr:hypothetical protein [Neobacillus sp. PS3-34]WML48832.1 hypothetical protein RCG23_01490 [Neobacillus sp. PS3-34]
MKDFHCCAACRHFKAERKNGVMVYNCSRLGYQTMPSYKFNCWDPAEKVKKLMVKGKGE